MTKQRITRQQNMNVKKRIQEQGNPKQCDRIKSQWNVTKGKIINLVWKKVLGEIIGKKTREKIRRESKANLLKSKIDSTEREILKLGVVRSAKSRNKGERKWKD